MGLRSINSSICLARRTWSSAASHPPVNGISSFFDRGASTHIKTSCVDMDAANSRHLVRGLGRHLQHAKINRDTCSQNVAHLARARFHFFLSAFVLPPRNPALVSDRACTSVVFLFLQTAQFVVGENIGDRPGSVVLLAVLAQLTLCSGVVLGTILGFKGWAGTASTILPRTRHPKARIVSG
ncbi:hypothetical protein B0H17DRAFT_1137529 [Mycena rosella]|uniref:Uncharacterized protein n=1 Tax=Mycena rosella TaxID=1033263 RepID=A0AAD7D877_MYCRO|nr:hypothetical protein B0H17DRAFT_1137529 [Mycena rosella]